MPLLGEKLVETNSRHWLHALWLQIRIRVTYFFDQWAGIKPVFMGISGYKSKFRPKNCPDYDIITRLGFVFIWLFAAGLRELAAIPYLISCKVGLMSLVNMVHTWLSDRLEAQFKARGYTEAQREVPIPEYDWEKGSPEEFYELFVKVPHPVILRNFMKGSKLTKEMTWKNILKKYGEEDVYLTKKELDGYPGKLKDVEDPKVYLHNSEKLFNKYPEIRTLFEYEKLEDYLTMKVGYEQLFIGKEGTGTPFHNAAVYNMFYMIDGTKKWWFIDPYDTFLAYPVCVLGRAASIVGCLWPHQYNVEAFPLFKYCPVYYAEVGPGDVLFNPPWWWHSIKNSAPHTVGVASRWHTDGIVGHKGMMSEEDYDIYRFGSFAFLNGLASFKFLHGILQEPSPKYDEHATLRETNNRFVHKQIKISEAGGVDVAGVKTKF